MIYKSIKEKRKTAMQASGSILDDFFNKGILPQEMIREGSFDLRAAEAAYTGLKYQLGDIISQMHQKDSDVKKLAQDAAETLTNLEIFLDRYVNIAAREYFKGGYRIGTLFICDGLRTESD